MATALEASGEGYGSHSVVPGLESHDSDEFDTPRRLFRRQEASEQDQWVHRRPPAVHSVRLTFELGLRSHKDKVTLLDGGLLLRSAYRR